MNNLNLLILAIYIICVAYVIYQAMSSLDNKLTIQVNEALLKQELKSKNIQDLVIINFGFARRYQLDDLKQLLVIVINISEQHAIYIDWDHCSITDLGGRSRRVIRLLPDMNFDLSQPQIFSVVAPKQILKESLTAEDSLKRKPETGNLEIFTFLVNVSRLEKGSPADQKRYADFIALKTSLSFSVRLALRWSDYALFCKADQLRATPDKSPPDNRVYVNCVFEIKKVPWTDALPWNQPKAPPKAPPKNKAKR